MTEKNGSAVLSVIVQGGPDGLELVGHMRARRFPGGVRMSGVLLAEERLARLDNGDREIAALLLDREGRELPILDEVPSRQGFPSATRVFCGCPRSEVDRGDFQVHRDPAGVRQLDVGVPKEAAFVVVYAARIVRRRIATEPLLAIRLDRGGPAVPDRIPPLEGWPEFPEPVTLAFQKYLDDSWILDADGPAGEGFVGAEVESEPADAPPHSRFDIVFIGDGFTEPEMHKYNRLARLLRDGLRKTQPFKRLDDKVRYHIVRAASAESGIDGYNPSRTQRGVAPGADDKRRTYFGFTSDPMNYGAPGYFGIGSMAKIRGATRKVTRAWSEVDLVIAIMNCPTAGGAGYLDHRLVVASKHPDERSETFVDRVAHECGHAICGLAEEYITSDLFEAGERYPNMATEHERIERRVWWRDLASPSEQRDEEFAVVHQYEDDLKPNTWLVPDLPAADLRKLGLFWGAQCVDGRLGYAVDQGFQMTTEELRRASRAGRRYYRPMVTCRMREVSKEFCRVCDRVIADSILAAASGKPRTTLRGTPMVDETPHVGV